MDINHLGEKTTKQPVHWGLVHNLADLYKLEVEDIQTLEGFAERSAKQLYQAIQNAKKTQLDRFIYALGIHHVGRRVARDLAREFRTLEKLSTASQQEISNIAGIGEEIAESVAYFFKDKSNQDVLRCIHKSGLKVQPMPQHRQQPLKDKNFVFTGSLENFTRDEAKEWIEALGARTTSSVSSETDHELTLSEFLHGFAQKSHLFIVIRAA